MAVELKVIPRYYSSVMGKTYNTLDEATEAEQSAEVDYWKRYPCIWTRNIATACKELEQFIRAAVAISNTLAHYRNNEDILRPCLVAKNQTLTTYISGSQYLEILINADKLAEEYPADYLDIIHGFMDTFYPGYMDRFGEEFFFEGSGLIGIYGKHETTDTGMDSIILPNAPLAQLDRLMILYRAELQGIFAHCQCDV